MKHYVFLLLYFLVCNQITAQFTLSGNVKTANGLPIEGVYIPIGMGGTTDAFGNYLIENLSAGIYDVTPEKNNDLVNGVNVCDLVESWRHLLGIEQIDSPYGHLAGDVNASGGITGLDRIIQQRMILGIDDNLIPEESWRFIDADFVFNNPANPWGNWMGYSNEVEVSENTIKDFIGFKVGDVNSSAIVDGVPFELPTSDILFFKHNNAVVDIQSNYVVEFTADDFDEVFGFQFTLSFDSTQLEFVEINSDELSQFFPGNFFQISENAVNFAWHFADHLSIPDGEVVFTATFNVLEQTDLETDLRFTNDHTPIVTMNATGCHGEPENVAPPEQFTLSGNIKTETDVPIEDVNVSIGQMTQTDTLGNYEFDDLLAGTYTVVPEKNTDLVNGVTVCDLVGIANHILGVEPLDSPYKILAADANLSNTITTLDLVKLRQLQLGIDEDLAPNQSWRFIDADYVFDDPTIPWSGGSGTLNEIDISENSTKDFIGLKVGDVDNSALGSYPPIELPNTDILSFQHNNADVSPQSNYMVEFTADDFIDVLSFQFTLSYDADKLEFVTISSNVLPNLNSNSFFQINNEATNVVWLNPDVSELSIPDGEVVFTATFNVLEQTDLETDLRFTNDHTRIVIMNAAGCHGELENVVIPPSPTGNVVGNILTETQIPVHNVELLTTDEFTDIDGFYEIQNPATGLTISPYKNDDVLNGVNVCDMIALRRHILGIELLDSPYKIIGADINGDTFISTFELVQFSRVLMGIDEDFGSNSSWRFVDQDFVFPSPANPFATTFPEVIATNSPVPEDIVGDFVAIKVGDLNNSALGSYPGNTVPDPGVLFFDFDNIPISQQPNYEVNFKAKDFVEALGFQFTLSYDPTKMEFVDINGVSLTNAAEPFFNVNLVEPGVLAVLWLDDTFLTISDDEIVFAATFNILEDIQLGESMMMTSDFLSIVSSNSQGCFGELNSPPFTTATTEISSLSNVDIFPNPTSDHLNLQLELTSTKNVKVELFNLIGNKMLEKSYNSQLIQDQVNIENLSDGIYFLSIHIDGETLSKKIVKGSTSF